MKKSSIRNLALAAVVAASLGAAGVASAQGHMMGGVPLSPEQQQTVQKLNQEFFDATADTRRDLMAKQSEIASQMHSATPDSAKIEALSKEVGALQGKLMAERAKLNAKLTKEGIPARGHMMGGMGGHMMGGMGGHMMGSMEKGCCMMGGMNMSMIGQGHGGHGKSSHRI